MRKNGRIQILCYWSSFGSKQLNCTWKDKKERECCYVRYREGVKYNTLHSVCMRVYIWTNAILQIYMYIYAGRTLLAPHRCVVWASAYSHHGVYCSMFQERRNAAAINAEGSVWMGGVKYLQQHTTQTNKYNSVTWLDEESSIYICLTKARHSSYISRVMIHQSI